MLVSLTDCSFTYYHFRRYDNLHEVKGKLFSVNVNCIRTSGKAACSKCMEKDIVGMFSSTRIVTSYLVFNHPSLYII